jgi:hypothetical protein
MNDAEAQNGGIFAAGARGRKRRGKARPAATAAARMSAAVRENTPYARPRRASIRASSSIGRPTTLDMLPLTTDTKRSPVSWIA